MQNLPVILVVILAAAAIIAVLLWRLKTPPAVNTEAADKRVAEETERARALQAKLDAGEVALRDALMAASTAKANVVAADARAGVAEANIGQARTDLAELQKENQIAGPLVAEATAQRIAAEEARADAEQRAASLVIKHDALTEEHKTALAGAASATKEAENVYIRNGEILAAYEAITQELDAAKRELIEAAAKQQSSEDSTRHFENISHAVLKDVLEEAKRGVGEMTASFQKSSGAELEKHADKITRTLEPLQAKLLAYDTAVDSFQKSSQENYGGLREQLDRLQAAEKSLHEKAEALTMALSDTPKYRGDYGELALKRLVESVGMQERCHFESQAGRDTNEGRKIPDMVISLPGGQKVVVDAKAVLNASVQAHEVQNKEQHLALLKKHCANVKDRVIELSAKNYFADHIGAVETVILFLPAENLYITAMQHDPHLTEYAASRKVIICGPSSLIMLLTVASQLWQQASIEKEVQDIRKCGNDIFKAACDFVEKFASIGKKIQSLETEYNSAVGTFEGRLLSAGKRMSAFESVAGAKELGEVEPVKDNVREFREATKQLAATTSKLSGPIASDFETASLSFATGEDQETQQA